MPDWMNLTPKGLFRVDYDVENRNYVEAKVDDPIVYLAQVCEVTDNLTIRDLCEFVQKHEELKSFISRYSHARYIDEHLAELGQAEPDPDMAYVEISWAARVVGVEDATTLEMGTKIRGVGEDPDYTYGIGGYPLGAYAHLPIRLNKEVSVDGTGDDPVLVAQKEFTLLEVLNAFFWEISFYGRPADRNRIFDASDIDLDDIEYAEPFDEEEPTVDYIPAIKPA